MAGPGRNDPCPCGSGRKVKRCCGQQRGPGENDLARAYLAHHACDAARRLRHLDDNELLELFDELIELPELDLALTITLPQLLTPEHQRLFDAIKADDPDAGAEVTPESSTSSTRPSSGHDSRERSSTCTTQTASTRCSPPPRSSTSTAAREPSYARASSTPRSSTPAECERLAACASLLERNPPNAAKLASLDTITRIMPELSLDHR